MFSSNRWEGLRPSKGWCWLIHLSTLTKSVCLEIKFRLKGPEYGFGIGAIYVPAVSTNKHPQLCLRIHRFALQMIFSGQTPIPSRQRHETFSHENETHESDFYKQTTTGVFPWHRTNPPGTRGTPDYRNPPWISKILQASVERCLDQESCIWSCNRCWW